MILVILASLLLGGILAALFVLPGRGRLIVGAVVLVAAVALYTDAISDPAPPESVQIVLEENVFEELAETGDAATPPDTRAAALAQVEAELTRLARTRRNVAGRIGDLEDALAMWQAQREIDNAPVLQFPTLPDLPGPPCPIDGIAGAEPNRAVPGIGPCAPSEIRQPGSGNVVTIGEWTNHGLTWQDGTIGQFGPSTIGTSNIGTGTIGNTTIGTGTIGQIGTGNSSVVIQSGTGSSGGGWNPQPTGVPGREPGDGQEVTATAPDDPQEVDTLRPDPDRRIAEIAEIAASRDALLTELDALEARENDARAGREALRAMAAETARPSFFVGTATLAHDIPDRMTYGRPVTVSLVVSPEGNPVSAAQALNVESEAVIEISERMRAFLTGASFDITEVGGSDRRVTGGRRPEWTWEVTPTSFGNLALLITVQALVREGDTDDVVLHKSYERTINVDVSRWDRLRLFLAELEPMQVTIGGILTILVAAGGIYAKLRSKSAGSEAPEPLRFEGGGD